MLSYKEEMRELLEPSSIPNSKLNGQPEEAFQSAALSKLITHNYSL